MFDTGKKQDVYLNSKIIHLQIFYYLLFI